MTLSRTKVLIYTHIYEMRGDEARKPTKKEEKNGKRIASVAVRMTQVNKSTPRTR